jgi:hypothetical protein
MKMRFATLAVALALGLGLTATSARADLLITPGSANLVATFIQNGVADINGLYGVSLLYKQNAGGSEEGSSKTNYSTSFNLDLSGGAITWDGPSRIVGSPLYFFVKDGSPRPQYLFDISAWDGQEQITFSGFYPTDGEISHVSIHGTTAVPDGGMTLMLLGGALIGLEGLRRKLRA